MEVKRDLNNYNGTRPFNFLHTYYYATEEVQKSYNSFIPSFWCQYPCWGFQHLFLPNLQKHLFWGNKWIWKSDKEFVENQTPL